MGDLAGVIAAAIGAFAGTKLDDMVLLTVLVTANIAIYTPISSRRR